MWFMFSKLWCGLCSVSYDVIVLKVEITSDAPSGLNTKPAAESEKNQPEVCIVDDT